MRRTGIQPVPDAGGRRGHVGLGCTLVLHGGRPDRIHPNLAAMQRWGAEVVFTGDPTAPRPTRRRSPAGSRGESSAEGPPTSCPAVEPPRSARSPTPPPATSSRAGSPIRTSIQRPWSCPSARARRQRACWRRCPAGPGPRAYRCRCQPPGARHAHRGQHTGRRGGTLSGRPTPDERRLDLVDAIGPGFGCSTPQLEATTRLALEAEGLVVDITYGARALRSSRPGPAYATGPIVFWHTGGALDAVADLLERQESG